METLTYSEMCQRYPNEWLLLDEPVYEKMDVVSGTVLAHRDRAAMTMRRVMMYAVPSG
jgi:hypothetical protein